MMKMLPRLATLGLATTLVVTLAACSVSQEETQECEQRGGVVTSEKFKYSDGWLGDRRTGNLYFCASPTGVIMNVYSDEILELDTGFFGPTTSNREIFTQCQLLGGSTYKTTHTSGKTRSTRYACVIDGRYRQILT